MPASSESMGADTPQFTAVLVVHICTSVSDFPQGETIIVCFWPVSLMLIKETLVATTYTPSLVVASSRAKTKVKAGLHPSDPCATQIKQ